MRSTIFLLPALILAGYAALPASAASVTVNSADNIYGAGQTSAPGGGNLPGSVAVTTGTSFVTIGNVTGSYTTTTPGCTSSAGCVTLNGGGNYNDADGVGAAPPTSSNTGAGSISGITGPGAGYLVGLFVAAGGPSGTAPAALDFTTGSGTSFSTLSPLLDQTFFIGDGLTGDGTGSQQKFYVPSGAVSLYLGISDAGFYNGSPGAYGDNFGTYSLSYAFNGGTPPPPPPTTPEPGSLCLLGVGLAGLIALRARRKA